MNKTVVIVEAYSTGINLVQDCLDRQLEPVILETRIEDPEAYGLLQPEREAKYRRLDRNIRIIRETSFLHYNTGV